MLKIRLENKKVTIVKYNLAFTRNKNTVVCYKLIITKNKLHLWEIKTQLQEWNKSCNC